MADAFYLMFFPLAYVAIVLLVRGEVRRLNSPSWLDSAVAGLGAVSVCAAFRVLPLDRLLDEAVETAQRLARRPRIAVAAAKRAVYEGGSATLPRGLHVEQAGFMATLTSAAGGRGMQAYVDGLTRTGELPLYDSTARERLLAGTYADLRDD